MDAASSVEQAYRKLAVHLERGGRDYDALRVYEELAGRFPTEGWPLLEAASIHRRAGRHQEEISALQTGLARTLPEAEQRRAKTRLSKARRSYRDALTAERLTALLDFDCALPEAADEAERSIDASLNAAMLIRAAKQFRSRRDPELVLALRAGRKALEVAQSDHNEHRHIGAAHTSLAATLRRVGRPDLALVHAERSLAGSGSLESNKPAHCARLAALCDLDRAAQAAEDGSAVLEASPEDPFVNNTMGRAFHESGQAARAVDCFATAVRFASPEQDEYRTAVQWLERLHTPATRAGKHALAARIDSLLAASPRRA